MLQRMYGMRDGPMTRKACVPLLPLHVADHQYHVYLVLRHLSSPLSITIILHDAHQRVTLQDQTRCWYSTRDHMNT